MIQPHTLESCHGYVDPPHCRARSRQTMAQIKKKAPSRSISLIFWNKVKLFTLRLGFLKKKPTVSKAMPPNGRLICGWKRQYDSIAPHSIEAYPKTPASRSAQLQLK